MKRKDFENLYEELSPTNFSSPSAKTRRLDADLVPISNEDTNSNVPLVFSGTLSHDQHLIGSTTVQTDVLPANSMPMGDAYNEKALVLYNPTQTTFFKSPSSNEFSMIINSDLIPSFKDHIFSLRNSKSLKPIEDEKCKGDTADASNDCLAVVPWVPSRYWSTPRREEEAVDSLIPMEAEEVDMMDTEENSVNCNGGPILKLDRMVEENEGLQNWQQQQQHFYSKHTYPYPLVAN